MATDTPRAVARLVIPPTPEWVRRAGARELPAYVVGGVPAPRPVARPEDLLAEYRRTHQAHPMEPGLDVAFDVLAIVVWEGEPID